MPADAQPRPEAPAAAAGRSAPTGRLAPSPTGHLHLGHARTFLLAWWHARAAGGRVVLRLEDLDATRVRPELDAGVLADLEWLGLDWDGPVRRQSREREPLEDALAELRARGLVYPCVCTRREVREAISAPHPEPADELAAPYPGTCRDRFADERDARERTGRDAALRFRTPPGPVRFEDRLAGPQEQIPAESSGDFPVTSRDGQIAYQLAVVVDDARQGVTEVVRGADLLESTAQQALLQAALGLPRPSWIHVPLVVDETGRRLAKRADDLALATLRSEGVDPRALVAWAARSAGQECPERASAAELVARFELERLPREPVALDAATLERLRAARA